MAIPTQPLDPDRLKLALSHWATYAIPAAVSALTVLTTGGADGTISGHDLEMAAIVFVSTFLGLLIPTPGVNQPFCNDPAHKEEPPKQ